MLKQPSNALVVEVGDLGIRVGQIEAGLDEIFAEIELIEDRVSELEGRVRPAELVKFLLPFASGLQSFLEN